MLVVFAANQTEVELRGGDYLGGGDDGSGLDMMEEDRVVRPMLMDRSERPIATATRPKR